jgi:lipoprotein-anchoring transpeptidase ErfK/SrfK
MSSFSKFAAVVGLVFGLAAAAPAEAANFKNLRPLITGVPSVTATVSIGQQRMVLQVVDEKGISRTYIWHVSTGKRGYATPTGNYGATWLSPNHWSKKYDAPMPFAVFFHGGYAIHATNAVARLGQPASHGCVRLAKDNAAMFFKLVREYGKQNTKIIIAD